MLKFFTTKQKIEYMDRLLQKQQLDDVMKRFRKVHNEYPVIDFRNNKNIYLDADKRIIVTVDNSFVISTMREITVYELVQATKHLGGTV
jgi:hypothetical protein